MIIYSQQNQLLNNIDKGRNNKFFLQYYIDAPMLFINSRILYSLRLETHKHIDKSSTTIIMTGAECVIRCGVVNSD